MVVLYEGLGFLESNLLPKTQLLIFECLSVLVRHTWSLQIIPNPFQKVAIEIFNLVELFTD